VGDAEVGRGGGAPEALEALRELDLEKEGVFKSVFVFSELVIVSLFSPLFSFLPSLSLSLSA